MYTNENDFSIKYKEEEFDSNNKQKKKFIKSNFPCGFVKNELDQEMVLTLSKPEIMNLECNPNFPEQTFDNKEIKEMRIEEKRIFELENCKLKSYSKNIENNIQLEENDKIKEQINSFSIHDIQKSRKFNFRFEKKK